MPEQKPDEPLHGEELVQKLNLETGRLGWPELQRHFARGMVVVVDPGLDLLEAADALAEDHTERFGEWAEFGLIRRASDEDARHWQATHAEFWAVVVAPWVLVQILGSPG